MIRFFVQGIPAPKGSARAFFVKQLGRAVITNANAKTRPWEQAIRAEASAAGCRPGIGPILVEAEFCFPRNKGHLGKFGLLPSAPRTHTKKPDLDKLVRALLDGLTGLAFADDAQVVELRVTKRYAPENGEPGVTVTITDADARVSLPATATQDGGVVPGDHPESARPTEARDAS